MDLPASSEKQALAESETSPAAEKAPPLAKTLKNSRNKWIRRTLGLTLLLLFSWQAVGFAVAYSFLMADYHDPQPFESPDARGLQFREVSIPVEVEPGRSIKLSGWLLPADESAANFQDGAIVLMVHGFGSGKGKVWTNEKTGYRGSLLDQGAESLMRGGFHVLMLDFRNFGDSEDFGLISLGLHESSDVVAAVNFIVNELPKTDLKIDPNRIGIRSPSMGAAATVLALADHPELPVNAVWLDSGFATAEQAVSDFLQHRGVPRLFLPPVKFWMQTFSGANLADVAPVQRIGSLTCPVMLVHSEDDTMIRVDHFLQLREATASMPQIETWMMDTQQHHRLWLDPIYHPRQLAFFQQHLYPPTSEQ